MITSAQPRSLSQFKANPCIVTLWLTRIPMAPIFRSGRTAGSPGSPSSARTHVPLRPSTRVASTPKSAQTRIIMSSRRRTWATTSIGSGSRTIGYPTIWPGPCQVIFPPRSTSMTGVPSSGRSWASVRLPAV